VNSNRATTEDDVIDRLRRFRVDHPEVTVMPPGRDGSGFWRARRAPST